MDPFSRFAPDMPDILPAFLVGIIFFGALIAFLVLLLMGLAK